ncbi:glycine cleavage system protein H [Methylophilaceae bacterium]|jgi:glycine cleavage system H protein|nr:glycine cleavage system protein H [Methylophilaceae bacterium]|tara:strand:- start:24 stop:401 length:378 start_codon:yes stop_codon:yes gene_type:complete
MDYIDNLFYTKEHIWIKPYQEEEYFLGITNFAQDLLGDIVYVDLVLGEKFNLGSSIGSIESVKTASDIIAPANGEIILINSDIVSNPEKINTNPHEVWLCRISLNNVIDKKNYLTKEEYLSLIKN